MARQLSVGGGTRKLSVSQVAQPNLLEGAIKQGVASATDPILAPFQLDSKTREMQSMYGAGREAILASDMPVLGAKARSGFSEEGPSINIPQNPIIGKQEIKLSPRNIAKQAQGLGVDLATGLSTDLAMSRGASAVGRSVLEPASRAIESGAGRMLNFLVKPPKNTFKFNANPGRGIVRNVGPQLTKEGLSEGVTNAKNRLLSQLETSTRENPNSVVDATPIFEQIRDTIKELRKFPETYDAQIGAHESLARDLDTLVSSKGKIGPDGRMYVNPSDALGIKRMIGELPSWGVQDPRLGSLTKTARKAYGAFDREIDKALPGNKQLNQDISDLIGAEKGLEEGMSREQNKWPVGLMEMIPAAIAGRGNVMSPEAIAVAGAIRAARSVPAITTAGSATGQLARGVRGVGRAAQAIEKPSMIESFINKLTTNKRLKPQSDGSTGPRFLRGPESQKAIAGQAQPPQLGAPENLFGKDFRTMTPAEIEAARKGLEDLIASLPQGPTPNFPKVLRPHGEVSPPRPNVERVPFRGKVNLEPKRKS